jgi:hypothetical protein
MLRDPIGMLRTLFWKGDAVLCKYAPTGYRRRLPRARNDAHPAPADSTTVLHVLLTVGSARLMFVAEFLNETEKEGSK